MGNNFFERFFARIDEFIQAHLEARSKELNKGDWSGETIAGIEERIVRLNLTRARVERLIENPFGWPAQGERQRASHRPLLSKRSNSLLTT